MSASREKRERKGQGSEAPIHQTPAAKQGMSRGLKTTLVVVCAVLVVAIVAFFTMISNGFFVTHSTAATVGNHNLSPAIVNYYYRSGVQQLSSYASYVGIDTDQSLTTQIYDESTGETWADLLIQQALNDAAATYAIYDEAIANGYTLSEDELSNIDATVEMYQSAAKATGYRNASAYIAAVFGTGCDEKSFREYMTVASVADGYRQQMNDSFTYTDDELAAEYEANPATYDTFNYRQFLISDSLVNPDSEDLTDEELTERKEALASEMASATEGDEQAFIDAAYENAAESSKSSYEDETYTLRSNIGSGIVDELLSWLSDDARQTGDTTYIDYSGTCYVLFFLSRENNDFNLPNVREIPFAATDSSDEDSMNEAKTNAEAALDEYEAGEQGVDAFVSLVQKYTSSETADGLTENVTPGSVSDAYQEWAFNTVRQAGDVAVAETSSGYSVLFFDGYGDTYRNVLVENALRSTAYNEWYSSVTDGAAYTENSYGMRFVSK